MAIKFIQKALFVVFMVLCDLSYASSEEGIDLKLYRRLQEKIGLCSFDWLEPYKIFSSPAGISEDILLERLRSVLRTAEYNSEEASNACCVLLAKSNFFPACKHNYQLRDAVIPLLEQLLSRRDIKII